MFSCKVVESMRFSFISGFLVVATLLIVATCLTLRFSSFAAEVSSLASVRDAAKEVFAAGTAEDRYLAATACLLRANELAAMPEVLGITGALYHAAVTPLAMAERELDIPRPDAVMQVATEDLLLISRLLFNTQRFEPADQLIELALRRQDEFREEALRLAVTIRFDLGRDQDVLQHCDELIAMKPDEPEFYRVQMMVHRNHGRWDNFVPAAEKAVKLFPGTDWPLLVELADGYTHLGRSKDARRIVDLIQRNQPGLMQRAPIVHVRLLMQEGKMKRAEEILEHVLSKLPEDDEALLLKGKMLVAKGEFRKAIDNFETVVRVMPSEEQAYYQLGQAHARLGDQKIAESYLAKHRELLDAKVRLFKLEQQAAREPYNTEVRSELVAEYRGIGLDELADFWARSAVADPETE